MSELNKNYELLEVPDVEVTPEDKGWLLMMALAQLSGRVLKEIKTMTILQREQAKVDKGTRSIILPMVNAIDRAGTDFVNNLRNFRQFYLTGNAKRASDSDRLAELVLESVMMPLEEAPGRMNELHAYLTNFRAGQYRNVNQKLFEAFEEVSDDHDEAIVQMVDKFCPRTSKANRENLALALHVLVVKRLKEASV